MFFMIACHGEINLEYNYQNFNFYKDIRRMFMYNYLIVV